MKLARYPHPVLSIGILSAVSLGYEIVLIRIFSIIHWYHFAYFVISISLLGMGASGTFLSLAQRVLLKNFRISYIVNALGFAIFIILSVELTQRVPFNTLEVLWNPDQWVNLLAIYLLLVIPFFLIGNCVGLALCKFKDNIHSIYAVTLLGNGIGAITVLSLLFYLHPSTVLTTLSSTAFIAAAICCFETRIHKAMTYLLLGIAIAVILLPTITPLKQSEFKPLQYALKIPGAEIIEEIPSPLGLITAVRNEQTPLRQVSGISLNTKSKIPKQVAIFNDGESGSIIHHYDGKRDTLSFTADLTSSLPYHLLKNPKVLIVNFSSGSDFLQAHYFNAHSIDAVESNPKFTQLFVERFSDISGWRYLSDKTQIHHMEARAFFQRDNNQYDLIQVPLFSSSGAAAGGVNSLKENYGLTTEAINSYMEHLKPNGFVNFTLWLGIPPKESLKLAATVIDSLKKTTAHDIKKQIVVIRGWRTTTLLVKNGIISDTEIDLIKYFCLEKGFDTSYFKGITIQDLNINNKLPEPFLFNGITALLSDNANTFIENYKFNIEPASDNNPYFSYFFKWSSAKELYSIKGLGGQALIENGYPLLVIALIQTLVVSFFLIITPLWFLQREKEKTIAQKLPLRISCFFFSIGLAFMLIEIIYIQKITLFIGHSIYSISLVVGVTLISAGIGSHYARRLKQKSWRPITYAIFAIISLTLLEMALYPIMIQYFGDTTLIGKVLISSAFVAPLAFFMGIPFPLAMTLLSQYATCWLPWALAINGCASVVSAVLATLLAVHLGFNMVILIAAALYCLAACTRLDIAPQKT